MRTSIKSTKTTYVYISGDSINRTIKSRSSSSYGCRNMRTIQTAHFIGPWISLSVTNITINGSLIYQYGNNEDLEIKLKNSRKI